MQVAQKQTSKYGEFSTQIFGTNRNAGIDETGFFIYNRRA
jgi:hypothetical protein